MMLSCIALILSCLFLFSSCGGTINGPEDIIFPEENVSYVRHVEPFMQFTCSYYGCHSYDYRAGGRDLSSYLAITDNAMNLGLVVPYQADKSMMIKYLKKEQYHRDNQFWNINQNHINGMIKWIDEGALNN